MGIFCYMNRRHFIFSQSVVIEVVHGSCEMEVHGEEMTSKLYERAVD